MGFKDSKLTRVAVRAFTFSTSRCRCCQASSGVSCSSDAKRSTYNAKAAKAMCNVSAKDEGETKHPSGRANDRTKTKRTTECEAACSFIYQSTK